MSSITSAPTTWDPAELAGYAANYPDVSGITLGAISKYNPTPGTGRTGYLSVPPNNYPFYSSSEKYVPITQADGGQLSEWQPMYNPTAEQAEADRRLAYETGVPHGYRAPGAGEGATDAITLRVVSELHDETEYGADVDPETGAHSGGPFEVAVSPTMRVEELRGVIYRTGGILPALQKLSFAGKNFEDSQRTLEQYGVAYWHKRFPHWAIKVRKY